MPALPHVEATLLTAKIQNETALSAFHFSSTLNSCSNRYTPLVMYNNLMFIVGLTGNYGMGKSAMLSMFRELGAVTIDADWVVQQLLREKQVLKR